MGGKRMSFEKTSHNQYRNISKTIAEALRGATYKVKVRTNEAQAPFTDSKTIVIGKLTLKVLVTTIDAQWEGMGDVGSVRYEPALLPPCPTIRVLSYSN